MPAEAAFCPECGTPRSVAAGSADARTDSRKVIGLMVAGAGALVIGIVAAIAIAGPEPESKLVASGTPSASSVALGARSAGPSSPVASTSGSAAGTTPGPAALLANRAIAEVMVDDLNLRMQPGSASEVRGQLQTSARVFVIGAPQEGDGMRWYRVAVVSGPYSRCRESGFCAPDIGWVAESGTPDEPWLSLANIQCPESPMSADQLASLAPLERLHCYGGNEFTVRGMVTTLATGLEGPIRYRYDPDWLAFPITALVFSTTEGVTTQSTLWLRFEEPDNLAPGNIISATLAMEHELAPSCAISLEPTPSGQTLPAVPLPEHAAVVLECRTQLVVKGYELLGHD